jgi:hypothetical protein
MKDKKQIKANVLQQLIDYMKGEEKASWADALKEDEVEEEGEEEEEEEGDMPKGVMIEETVIVAKPKKKK